MSQWLDKLNPEQREAASHVHGPLLILAGAGSGKTTVLAARARHLHHSAGIPAECIGVVTFTNKAARELRHRIGDSMSEVWTGTFHRMGLEILRTWPERCGLEKQFGIIDQSDAEGVLRELMQNIHNSTKSDFQLSTLLKVMGDRRKKIHTVGVADEYLEMAEVLLPKYRSRMQQLGVVDFDDLLLKPIELIKQDAEVSERLRYRFQYLMVDEFQDTNDEQLELITLLTGTQGNLAVVGDDDQAIYGWRGAEVKNILRFDKKFAPCKVVKLVRNYRCSPQILSIANEVIAKNTSRHQKRLVAESQNGEVPELFVYEDEDQEISQLEHQIVHFRQKGFEYEDMAILYRSNSLGGLCEGLLRRSKIPYTMTGGQGLFDRKEVKDAMAYLRCALRPSELAFRRILNTPNRGVGEKTFEAIKQSPGGSTYQKGKNYAESHQHQSLKDFFGLLNHLKTSLLAANHQTVDRALIDALEKAGYWNYLLKTNKKAEVARQKWMAIEILGRVMQSYFKEREINMRTLREFVDFMDLRDTDQDDDRKGVQLLTLHACKGLEYPVVFIIGLEEDILPHRTLGSDVEEERRLFYVGLTRAKRHLVLSHCRTRQSYGKPRPVAPSRFLSEIPEDLITVHTTGFRPVSSEQRQNLMSQFMANLNNKIESRN